MTGVLLGHGHIAVSPLSTNMCSIDNVSSTPAFFEVLLSSTRMPLWLSQEAFRREVLYLLASCRRRKVSLVQAPNSSFPPSEDFSFQSSAAPRV